MSAACQATWSLTGLISGLNNNLFTKTSGANAYDASAQTNTPVRSITVKAQQTSLHVRFGLTADNGDDYSPSHGRFLGLFDKGVIYVPDGTDGTYSTDDEFTLTFWEGSIIAYKGLTVIHAWTTLANGDPVLRPPITCLGYPNLTRSG